ncbi:MAG: UDP-N-acetylglucosamine 2-epimerase [Thiohalocapsa sp.]|nr:UDP-N-acetylglucosamine 2-epimerase [Thiohalocapsa sp.]MCF7991879.1 UDP-N-acetylglucosamine 2-epimerase [Thiohalocapsa sp.]
MANQRIAVVINTRAEAIKLAPVYLRFGEAASGFDTALIAMGRTPEQLDSVLSLFGIKPDMTLDPEQGANASVCSTGAVMEVIDGALQRFSPDMLLYSGETPAVSSAALSAFRAGIPVGRLHADVEAEATGGRYPERINHCLSSAVAHAHFAPTERARRALMSEGVPAERIAVTGDTIVDALAFLARKPPPPSQAIHDADSEAATLADRELISVLAMSADPLDRGGASARIVEAVRRWLAGEWPALDEPAAGADAEPGHDVRAAASDGASSVAERRGMVWK